MADRDRIMGGLAALAIFLGNMGDPISDEQAGICADALALLKEQEQTPGEWVSVKDRLPEDGTNVLVCLYDGRRRKISEYPDGRRKTIRIDHIVAKYGSPAFWSKGNTPSVIAWMPLPEPPKE